LIPASYTDTAAAIVLAEYVLAEYVLTEYVLTADG